MEPILAHFTFDHKLVFFISAATQTIYSLLRRHFWTLMQISFGTCAKINCMWRHLANIMFVHWLVWFCCSGRSLGCPLISTASMFEWLRNFLPHHSQGSSTERWSRNTLRVVTARVFYVLRGFLTSPFILNNSVETAAPFNVFSHPGCSEPRN